MIARATLSLASLAVGAIASPLIQLAPRDTILNASSTSAGNDTFILEQHLGNLSPYFTPSSNLSLELPAECSVDQVVLMQRHGSRYPLASELVYITNVSTLLTENADKLQNLTGPYEFLKSWKPTLGHDDLTSLGRLQLFSHGVAFNLTYPHLSTSLLTVGGQDRVEESAEWFRQGYYGRDYANRSTVEIIAEDSVTFSPITPMDNCSVWEYSFGTTAVGEWNDVYLPPIQERLSGALGLNLSLSNVHGMLYSCAYSLAAYGSTPWCAIFTESEILDFEYELDLLMSYAFGYGLPTESGMQLGPVLGSVYVNQLLERLTNSTGNASEMYLEFGHDTTIDLALSALGLAKDTPNIAPVRPLNPDRAWRTSTQVPFAAKFVVERLACGSEKHVRILLNDAPFPITTCGAQMNVTTGTCPLDAFIAANNASASVTKATYDQVCNNTSSL